MDHACHSPLPGPATGAAVATAATLAHHGRHGHIGDSGEGVNVNTRGSDDLPFAAATIFALMGFFVAATWIDVFAGELAAALEFFAALSGIKPEILGLTLLAWGNSVGDYFTNVAMARKGLANMAPTGACVKASRRVPSTATPALTG